MMDSLSMNLESCIIVSFGSLTKASSCDFVELMPFEISRVTLWIFTGVCVRLCGEDIGLEELTEKGHFECSCCKVGGAFI